jgi:hypothetical protein
MDNQFKQEYVGCLTYQTVRLRKAKTSSEIFEIAGSLHKLAYKLQQEEESWVQRHFRHGETSTTPGETPSKGKQRQSHSTTRA